jgi:H+/Cl- antiporter ClcA
MALTILYFIFYALLLYLTAGLVFALLFAFRWVEEVDEQAKHAPLFFRLLIIPAAALLWIFLLKKVRERKKT